MKNLGVLAIFILACLVVSSSAEQHQHGGRRRAGKRSGGVASLISSSVFEEMLKHRNDTSCPAKGFYTYDAFMAAANAFPGFATTGGAGARKREIAAFLAHTSHQTRGEWTPDDTYAWGYCLKKEQGKPGNYCVPDAQWPCAPEKMYYGRGPMQISYNYNYGPAGKTLGVDLLGNPDLVAKRPILSFKTALWVWMTPQSPKPSCHQVITGEWEPLAADKAAGRLPGFGTTINVLDGAECGTGPNPDGADRIGFYERYCGMLGVSSGANEACYSQQRF